MITSQHILRIRQNCGRNDFFIPPDFSRNKWWDVYLDFDTSKRKFRVMMVMRDCKGPGPYVYELKPIFEQTSPYKDLLTPRKRGYYEYTITHEDKEKIHSCEDFIALIKSLISAAMLQPKWSELGKKITLEYLL